MAEDFHPFIDAPGQDPAESCAEETVRYATRIAVYDDLLSTPRVLVVEPADIRSYLEEITNTVYRSMRDQGGRISLMVIRELVENFIHANFSEPVVSILDDGNTVRFADQGPGIEDKERAFEFGITSADQRQKRYIRGTGAGLPMVEQYLEHAGGAISIEDNLNQGTVVTVSVDRDRVEEITRSVSRGAVVRGGGAPAGGAPTTSTGAQGIASGPQAPAGGQSYQQSAHQFSTNQQSWPLPADSHQTQAMGAPASPWATNNYQPPIPVSERGLLALQFIAGNGSAGPTELANAYGESTPTWSRELATLSTIGLVVKQGQKRVLTEVGRMWIQQQQR